MTKLAMLKNQEKELKEEIDEIQKNLLSEKYGKVPKEFETEYGVLKFVDTTPIEVSDTEAVYEKLKKKSKISDILKMMKFSITNLRKQIGQKAVDQLLEEDLAHYGKKKQYFRLNNKK